MATTSWTYTVEHSTKRWPHGTFFLFFRYKTMEDCMATHNILPLHHPRSLFFHHMATQNILQVHSHMKHSSSTRLLPLLPEPSSKLDHKEYFSSSVHMEHSSSTRSNMAFFPYIASWNILQNMVARNLLTRNGLMENSPTFRKHWTFFHIVASWNILPLLGHVESSFATHPMEHSSSTWPDGPAFRQMASWNIFHFLATRNLLSLHCYIEHSSTA